MRFFPKNIFDKNDEEDDHIHRKYAGNLHAMKEKPIYDTNSPDLTIYRFLHLKSFSIPIMIKVTVKQNENNLKAIIPSGPRSVREKEINKTLNDKEIQEIESYIEKMDFWNLNTTNDARRPVPDERRGIFEIYDKSNKYHVIDRLSPGYKEDTKIYAELINYLLNLADANLL